jgi:SprT protein
VQPSKIRELIQFACDKNGRPDIAAKIKVEWSNRMTVTMGHVRRDKSSDGFTIRLSTKLFARATPEQQRQTVIHEACHVIDALVNKEWGHGAGWKTVMRCAGVKANVHHEVCTDGLVKEFVYACPNNCHDFKLSTRMHNSMVKGQRRICRTCSCFISFTGQIEGVQ